ncbi:restriction endonuclease [Nitrosococcus oceani]|nr:restriction endonuclease [Nitrosococcus oceani]
MAESVIKGPIVVAIGNFDYSGGFRFSSTRIKRYTEDYPKEYQLQPGDVLLAMTCQTPGGEILGLPGIIPEDDEVYLHNQRLGKLIVKEPKKVWAPFLYWVFLSYDFNRYLAGSATGTKILHTSPNKITSYETRIPPINLQQSIANILWSISDKISLNHQINQILEQMAQAIFKSWFVDFEPVKAKIAALKAGGSQEDALLAAMQAISGKSSEQLTRLQAEQPEQYAQLRTTAELFPSAMQDSELGEIPEGWSCRALDDIAKYKNGLALQKFRPENENDYLPVVKIAQLKKGYADGEEKASPNINPECIIDNGDVVFSWSGSLLVDTWCGGRAALNQHLFKVTSETHPKWLYYHFTQHHLEDFQRIAADKAVTMGHIKREHLKRALCAIPCEQLISDAGNSLRNILEKQIELRLESITLSTLRDTLLPKLLSGELSISDAESRVSEMDVSACTEDSLL